VFMMGSPCCKHLYEASETPLRALIYTQTK